MSRSVDALALRVRLEELEARERGAGRQRRRGSTGSRPAARWGTVLVVTIAGTSSTADRLSVPV